MRPKENCFFLKDSRDLGGTGGGPWPCLPGKHALGSLLLGGGGGARTGRGLFVLWGSAFPGGLGCNSVGGMSPTKVLSYKLSSGKTSRYS